MTTTRKVRAGQPFNCSAAGCNSPQSECLGFCLHRVDSSQMQAPFVERHGSYENSPMPFSEIEPVQPWTTFRPLVIAGFVIVIFALFVWRIL